MKIQLINITPAKTLLVLLTLCFLLATPPAHGIDQERLKTFLRGNDYWNLRLSPDGKHLGLLTQQDERNMLVILDVDTMKPTASVKYEENKKIEITSAEWVNNSLLSYSASRKAARLESPFATPDFFLLSADGKRNERIWSDRGNYQDNRKRRGTLVRGFPSMITRLPEQKDKVLIFVKPFRRRDGAGRGGIYSLDLDQGNVNSVMRVPEYTQRVLGNEEGSVLLASALGSDNQNRHYLSRNRNQWEELPISIDKLSKEFVPFEIAGDYIYAKAQASDAIDAATHIIRYQMSTDKWEDVFEVGFAYLGDVDINDEGALIRVQWVDDKPKMRVLEKSEPVSRIVKHFMKSYEGFNVSVVSITEDESKLLLHIGSGAHAGEYFLFDFKTRKAKFLLATMEGIDGNNLGELEDASYTASDDVVIPGWFQAPKGEERPALVVYVHGGPHGPFNAYRFNTRWHLLNEMGYAVYAPNFRGSGGYGRNFEHSGYRQWGTRMIDDVYEGVQALIEKGRVDPEKVCIFGGSYGGYASAQSLVRYNDFYRCGVIVAGFFDASTQMDRSDTSGWYAGDEFMFQAIGDDATALQAMSPILHIDKIKAPMLLIHGEEDERTPFKGAVEFTEALKAKGKEYEYQWYKKEGHGNAKLENRIDEWNRIEAFLKKSL